VIDFTKGANSAFVTTNGEVSYGPEGATFEIKTVTDGPTLASNELLFFGKVECSMKAAPGAGIVSSFILESDDLDEIDWEIIGSQTTQAQSNYFGKGNTTTYDRGQMNPVANPQTEFHTFAIDWRPNATEWLIDGKVVRTLLFNDAVGGENYPQTPMNVRLGNWVAGSPSNAQGTIEWAGGLADLSKAPFNMTVKTCTIQNYLPAVAYSYGDSSGSWQSIKLWNSTESNSTASATASVSGTVTLLVSSITAGSSLVAAEGSSTVSASGTPAGGIVAAGSVNATPNPTVTMLVSGASSASGAVAAESNSAKGSMTTQISSPLNGTTTTAAGAAKQTTADASSRYLDGRAYSMALAVFFGLAVILA
jgi:hypothetical protein